MVFFITNFKVILDTTLTDYNNGVSLFVLCLFIVSKYLYCYFCQVFQLRIVLSKIFVNTQHLSPEAYNDSANLHTIPLTFSENHFYYLIFKEILLFLIVVLISFVSRDKFMDYSDHGFVKCACLDL